LYHFSTPLCVSVVGDARPLRSSRHADHGDAALAYPIGDIVGGLAWRGYSHASQGVSELMAIGTQPRPAVLAIATTKVVIPAKAGIHCR
jgi:hypothetical protein